MNEITIDKNAKQITFTNNGIGFSQFGIANEILDLIEQQRKEIERLDNIIEHTDIWIDRTIEIIKQQPSEDDTWILERLNGIKQCLKGK